MDITIPSRSILSLYHPIVFLLFIVACLPLPFLIRRPHPTVGYVLRLLTAPVVFIALGFVSSALTLASSQRSLYLSGASRSSVLAAALAEAADARIVPLSFAFVVAMLSTLLLLLPTRAAQPVGPPSPYVLPFLFSALAFLSCKLALPPDPAAPPSLVPIALAATAFLLALSVTSLAPRVLRQPAPQALPPVLASILLTCAALLVFEARHERAIYEFLSAR